MNCFRPIKICNPHFREYIDTARHLCFKGKGNFAATYTALVNSHFPYGEPYIEVPCGKCEACLVRRTNEWSFRLLKEMENSTSALFVTLTYDDLHVPRYVNTNELTINKRDCQLFIKRLRKRFGNGIRFFLCSEYGENFARPHYHALLFNLPIDFNQIDWRPVLELELFGIWKNGNLKVDKANHARCVYCAKYMLSNLDNDNWLDRQKPFLLMSRMPAIGSQFCKDEQEQRYRYETCDTKCVTSKGIAFPMHRYYKDKFFDDSCKEIIKERAKENYKVPSKSEIDGFKTKIRNSFKKQKKL